MLNLSLRIGQARISALNTMSNVTTNAIAVALINGDTMLWALFDLAPCGDLLAKGLLTGGLAY